MEGRMFSAPRSLRDYRMLLSSILACQAAGVVGGVATARSVNTWYATLKKPAFTPPSWVFGPVWTTLYLLMGVSLYLIRKGDVAPPAAGAARKLFAIQLLLNALWSFVFFGLRSPRWALVEIVGLWGALVLTLRAVSRVSRPAAVLLVPYLLWTSFALVLNYAIWRRNAGRAASACG